MTDRPRAPLPCRRCGSMNVRVIESIPDPDLLDELAESAPELADELRTAGLNATIWRRRTCRDCGAPGYSAEIAVDGRLARRRLSGLRLWRTGAHARGWRADACGPVLSSGAE